MNIILTIILLVMFALILYDCIYKDQLKSSQADQDTPMECDQIRFNFQQSLLCSPCNSFIGVLVHISSWQKVINSSYDVIIWTFQPMNFSALSRTFLLLTNFNAISTRQEWFYVERLENGVHCITYLLFLWSFWEFLLIIFFFLHADISNRTIFQTDQFDPLIGP